MFILRRIVPDGNEINTCIGNTYNYIRKEENKDEYEKTLNYWLKGLKREDNDIYGFLVYNSGADIMPLYQRSVYFIMTSNGQTFANITKK